MSETEALTIVEKIFNAVFGVKNPFTLEEVMNKFAFDVKIPLEVRDSTTGEKTWTAITQAGNYMTTENMRKTDDWMIERKPFSSLNELLEIWKEINLINTERLFDSINVAQSDTIYGSENVWRSNNCGGSKNLVFCDGIFNSEYMLASQRSESNSFGIRVDDSNNCTNCYNVICSGKVSNSFFIQDCLDVTECMFCSHIVNKKYCIANMQFEKEEYFEIKQQIVEWIINS